MTNKMIDELYNDTGIKIGPIRISILSKPLDSYKPLRQDYGLATQDKGEAEFQKFYKWARDKGLNVFVKPFSYMKQKFGDYVGLQEGRNLYVAEDMVTSNGEKRELNWIEKMETLGHEFGHYIVEQLENLGYILGLTKKDRELAAQALAVDLFSERGAFSYQPAYELAAGMYETMDRC